MITKKLIGYCAVDSGQIMIVDPCYVLKEMDAAQAEDAYKEVCSITLNPDAPFGQKTFSGIAGDGVVSSTYDGDGNYPVYAHVDESGRPRRITIHLY